MQMKLRLVVKHALLRSGTLPLAWSLYRRFNPRIRAAKATDRALYSTFVKQGDLVFDVGVNLGQKSEIFLDLGARVIGVEPNSLCEPTLRYLFGLRGNFTLVPAALADKEGHMTLHRVGSSPTASLRSNWAWVAHEGTPTQAEVEVTTLDCLIARHGVPQFCKIDVEGYEVEVLRGLSQPLPLISFEYHLEETDRLRACLTHLAALSDVRVNVIAMNGNRLLLSQWVQPSDLDLSALPNEGDCFVRSG
jgi:FkbM family methyltransferase